MTPPEFQIQLRARRNNIQAEKNGHPETVQANNEPSTSNGEKLSRCMLLKKDNPGKYEDVKKLDKAHSTLRRIQRTEEQRLHDIFYG